jgi:hypothetical protein
MKWGLDCRSQRHPQQSPDPSTADSKAPRFLIPDRSDSSAPFLHQTDPIAWIAMHGADAANIGKREPSSSSKGSVAVDRAEKMLDADRGPERFRMASLQLNCSQAASLARIIFVLTAGPSKISGRELLKSNRASHSYGKLDSPAMQHVQSFI